MHKRLILFKINDGIFNAIKTLLSVQNQYLAQPVRGAISASIRRGMESNRFLMSDCGREFHIACMSSNSLSFEAAGRRSRAKHRPTKSHTSTLEDISGELAGQGKSCMCWAEQEFRTDFAVCGRALSC
ncbi:UNVERIFIED_CONTAM: hypothetical protein NCL1_21695 [Trichonephila clavipes]